MVTAPAATSRAASVREKASWSARKRSIRSVGPKATPKRSGSPAVSAARGGASGDIFAPERDEQGHRTAGDRDVGDVEGGPAPGRDSDIDEVHHTRRGDDAIDQVA